MRTLKAEAFLPYRHVELSVIRHRDLLSGEMWEIAKGIAALRNRPLVGRGDFYSRDARAQKLDVIPAEGAEMPKNHADVVGWPPEKPQQMLIAALIAASATFSEAPADSNRTE
jgi:hypothetical protein